MKTGSVTRAFKHALLVGCAILTCSAYSLAPPVERAAKDAQDRMVQSISSHNPKDVRAHKSQGFFKFVGCKKGATIPLGASKTANSAEVADTFMNQFGPAFGAYGPNVESRLTRELTRKEDKFLRIGQWCAGVPIFGSEIVVDVTKDNEVRSAIAKIATAPELAKFSPPSAIILAPEAMGKAVEDLARKGPSSPGQSGAPNLQTAPTDYDSNLVVFAPSVLNLPGIPTLAWQIDLRGIEVRYFVDADSGVILLTYPLYYEVLDREIYDDDSFPNLGSCPQLGNPVRSEHEGPLDPDPARVNDAYDYLGLVYNFFSTRYDRDSFDGNGGTIYASLNYCYLFYSCPWVNAQFIPLNPSEPPPQYCPPHVFFAFGEDILTDDVVGHEYTHGVSYNICHLVYAEQPGAICESLSDIFGEFIDLQTPDNSGDKWLIGEDLAVGALRSMADPPSYCHQKCNTEYCGVDKKSDFVHDIPESNCTFSHENSGIASKLCYLISDGGTFNSVTVAPLDSYNNAASMGLAVDLFYDAMYGLPEASDFDCLYYALKQSAENLDFSATQKLSLQAACEAVEIAPEPSFVIKIGGTGKVLARFTTAGDLIVYSGSVHAQDSEHLEPSGAAFIVKDADSNLLCLPYDTGELYIAGKLYTDAAGFTEPALALKVKSGESLVAFVTGASYADSVLEPEGEHTVPAGSIILTGEVSECTSPDCL